MDKDKTEVLVETIYRYQTKQIEIKEVQKILNLFEVFDVSDELFLNLVKQRGDIICHYYEGEWKI